MDVPYSVFKAGQSRPTVIQDRNSRIPSASASSFDLKIGQTVRTHLIVVFGDRPLPTASVNPSDKVFHVSRNHHGGISDGCRSHSNVSLFDRSDGLKWMRRMSDDQSVFQELKRGHPRTENGPRIARLE
jgi:hypothetical protein